MSFGYGEGKPICTDPEHRSRSVVTAIIYPRVKCPRRKSRVRFRIS